MTDRLKGKTALASGIWNTASAVLFFAANEPKYITCAFPHQGK